MTLADRIVILNGGDIEQVGTPDEVYNHPASVFVGGFIGSPAMNFAQAIVTGGKHCLSEAVIAAACGDVRQAAPLRSTDEPIIVGIRPEHFRADGQGVALTGQVQVVEPLGSDTLVHFRLAPAP